MIKVSPVILMILLVVSTVTLQGCAQVGNTEMQKDTLLKVHPAGNTAEREEYEHYLNKNCKGAVMSLQEFLRDSNVFADNGKCVSLTAARIQPGSATTGFFSILQSDDIVFVEFPMEFHGNLVQGVFQLQGEYTYETQMNTSYSIPRLLFLVGSP
ncbi:MAG TPA: hypothetical protein VEI57_05315 [Nitrospirota bacterium]|nr:hypothetical protein [Nitrospirota bacterium]